MVSFDEYIAYFRRNNSTDRGRICEVGGTSLSRSRSARAKATGARVFQSKAGAIFHIPSVPETTDYDPFDWNWSKIPGFAARSVQLDLNGAFKVQVKRTQGDMMRLFNLYQQGNYESVVGFWQSLVKEITLSANIKRNSLVVENIVELARDNGIEEIRLEIPRNTVITDYMMRKTLLDKILQTLANFKQAINYGQGHVGTSSDDYALLISENKFYDIALAMGIQGSDSSYHDLIQGRLERVMGVKIIPIPYLENKYSISVREEVEDGETKWKDIEVVLTEPHAILFHKNIFPFKFSQPLFSVDKIAGAFVNIFTHMEYYPKDLKKQNNGDWAYILPKFCKGFNFNITYAEQ